MTLTFETAKSHQSLFGGETEADRQFLLNLESEVLIALAYYCGDSDRDRLKIEFPFLKADLKQKKLSPHEFLKRIGLTKNRIEAWLDLLAKDKIEDADVQRFITDHRNSLAPKDLFFDPDSSTFNLALKNKLIEKGWQPKINSQVSASV